ncbi:MAG: cobyrinate a,c-diamide synthase, partial [Methanomassiliicoccaceae archaeon]|nr:cobyrinate a,c-diamide synthase [Methanomassiliicoccaceae archaeon]
MRDDPYAAGGMTMIKRSEKKKMPRILVTAASSGGGKTTVTCGLLQALVNRKMDVAAFKCGPDHIDAMFHEKVIEARSKNIDLFLTDEDTTKYLFGREAAGADISVIEGVMGFYDGRGLTAVDASSYDISSKLGTPVIFVATCGMLGGSLGALVKGYVDFRKNNIKGIILNKATEDTYPEVKEFIERETGIKVLGYLPNVKEMVIGSRHLGLILPSEVEKLKDKLNKLADVMERTIDIDSIIEIANGADDLEYSEPDLQFDPVKVRIGVASDDCFCFLYKDNMELLERLGAEIVYFSPLKDERLPADINGIIIPGGYPELYADRLSENRSMLDSIKESIDNGMPCMAEAGGFMYLHNELEDISEKFHRMVGAIDEKAF